jgi:NhaP-type Na+/H+ or K+/H+ antiporter
LSGRLKFAIAGAVIGFIVLLATPLWPLGVAIIVLALALPAGAYLMLDPSQRRRLRDIQRRRQLGR